MNIIKNFKIFYITFIIVFILLNCSSKKGYPLKDLLGYYTIVDSLNIETPGFWYGSGRKIDNMIIVLNLYEHRLELYTTSGKLLSHCGKYGKGPCEFTNPELFDYFNNNIYLIDSGNNKIVIIKLDKKNQELIYKDEFHLKDRPRDICVIGKDKILVSVGDVKNIKLYNYHGELLQEYIVPEIRKLKNYKDLLFSGCSLENIDNEYFLVGSVLDMELFFCYFNHNNNIKIIKDKNVRLQRKSKGMVDRGEYGIDIFGIRSIICSNDNYYISFRSDMPEMKKMKDTIFEIYDKHGTYLGYILLYNKHASYIALSSDADTLWFKEVNNDSLLYRAQYVAKKEIK